MENITLTKDSKPVSSNPSDKENKRFYQHIINKNSTAITNINSKSFNLMEVKQRSGDALIALNASGGLQSMLAAQMLSIHELQQRAMIYAHSVEHLESKKYYTNAVVKLSNCFVQQANTLAKLQGMGGQKIIVERVDVHQGGQAIVGNIQGDLGNKEKK